MQQRFSLQDTRQLFLLDCRAQGLTDDTLRFYRGRLSLFVCFCAECGRLTYVVVRDQIMLGLDVVAALAQVSCEIAQQVIVGDRFMPDPEAVQHVVDDVEAQERSHPLFESLYNQFEEFTQSLQRLRRRRVFVKLPDRDKVLKLRTPTVPAAWISRSQLQRVQKHLANRIGLPTDSIQAAALSQSSDRAVPEASAVADERFWRCADPGQLAANTV